MLHFRSSKLPCDRDIAIFFRRYGDNHKVREIAQEYGISKQSVSRICKKVRNFYVFDVPSDGLSPDQQLLLQLRCCHEWFNQTRARCETEFWNSNEQSSETITFDGEGNKVKEVRQIKRGRMDVRLLDRAMKARKEEMEEIGRA